MGVMKPISTPKNIANQKERNNIPNLNMKLIPDYSTEAGETTKRTNALISTENQEVQVKPTMCSIATQNSNKICEICDK